MADIAELMAERDQLQERLADSTRTEEEQDADIARAAELRSEIDALNERVRKANEARASIADAAPEQVVVPTATRAATLPAMPRARLTHRAIAQKIASNAGVQAVFARNAGKATVELDEFETRLMFAGLFTRAIDEQELIQPLPSPGVVAPLHRELRVADLLNRQPTGAAVLTYVRDTSANSGEGSAAFVSAGGAKQETAKSFEVVQVPMRTLAHYVKAPMQALEDTAGLEGYLRGELTYGLAFKLDDELVNGSGIAPGLDGIVDAGTADTDPNSEEIVDSIRHAKTLAQRANVSDPSLSVLLSPEDWDAVETVKAATTGNYLSQTTAFAGVGPRIWGMPVVVTNALSEGTGVVGAFKSATLWERMGATVTISDSNEDDFIHNLLTIRAELRCGLAIPRPDAFQVITFDPPS